MKFLDEVFITARSGDGGRGCISFRREKFIPRGGPDGGDGGNGGDVIFRATRRLVSLSEYGSRTYFRAQNGGPGKGKNRSGKRGADLILEVPLGTTIQDAQTSEVLADLIHDKQEVLLIPGGRGGKGNQHFATPTNRTPRFAQPGIPGQEKKFRLSLRFLADIGLIGLPNAGKSTLLSRLTRARPRVDSYPFTTIDPNLGIMTLEEGSSLVLADIPGLIEGASMGRGLGHQFLKHIERTSLLFHLLDITYQPRNDLIEDFHILRKELEAYNPALMRKPQVVLLNKMDLYGPRHRDIEKVKRAIGQMGLETLSISALTGEGIEELKAMIREKWHGR